MVQPIIPFSSSDASIVFKTDLKSLTSVTDPDLNGIAVPGVAGTGAPTDGVFPTFDGSLGMLAVTAGVRFDGAILGHDAQGVVGPLDTEGQMSWTVTRQGAVKRDNGGSVSGSDGVERSATSNMYAFGADQFNSIVGQGFHSNIEDVKCFIDGGSNITAMITSLNKLGDLVFTISWTATTERLFVGVEGDLDASGNQVSRFLDSNARTSTGSNMFFALAMGCNLGGVSLFSAGETLYIRDLVISSAPVLLNTSPYATATINGDSFANLDGLGASAPRYDGTVANGLTRAFINAGFEPPTITNSGLSGGTICDTGANDLSPLFGGWNAAAGELAFFMMSNNDSTVLDTNDVTDPTTGTDANGKALLDLLDANAGVKKVVILNTGSLLQDTILDTPTNVSRRDDIVNPIVNAWESYSAKVSVINAITILNDVAGNQNYQGYWDNLGNLGTGGSVNPGTMENRHLSGNAGDFIGDAIYAAIFAVSGSPILTTPYSIRSPEQYGPQSTFYQNYSRTTGNITSYDFSNEFKAPFAIGDLMWARLSDGWATLRFISTTNVEVL